MTTIKRVEFYDNGTLKSVEFDSATDEQVKAFISSFPAIQKPEGVITQRSMRKAFDEYLAEKLTELRLPS